MSTPAIGRFSTTAALRAGISVTLAISGLIHAELYVHGYRHVPTIGLAFLAQASVFVALAILIPVGGPRWLHWAVGLGALGSLMAFASSRTIEDLRLRRARLGAHAPGGRERDRRSADGRAVRGGSTHGAGRSPRLTTLRRLRPTTIPGRWPESFL